MKISKVLIEQNQIEQKVKELAERINKDYLGEELVIVGILKGAFIVISDIAKQLDVDVTFDPPWNPEMMSDEARSKLGFETVTATVKEPKVNVEWE